MIGQIVNHYVIRGLIGQGGMGAVYLAEHSFIGRRAAIKVLRRAFADDGAVIARFMNEARAANAIRHRNIIDILDVGRLSDGLPYLLMEYLEGETLGQRLARVGRLPVADAVAIIGPAAAGLSAAHQAGIVHRDLKPDNIFLAHAPRSDTERVILLDFGVAKLRGDPSNVATGAALLGTPAYMSPEQCRGIGEVDARTDVYALGTILYQMLCGRVPFVSNGFGDVLVKHLLEAPAPPRSLVPEIPAPVEAMILRSLSKDPDRRFASMDEAWAALCSATPTPGPVPIGPAGAPSAPPSGRAARAPAPQRGLRRGPPPLPDSAQELRRSGLLSKVVVASAVVLSVGAWAWMRGRPDGAGSHAAHPPPMAIPVPAIAPEPEPPTSPATVEPPVGTETGAGMEAVAQTEAHTGSEAGSPAPPGPLEGSAASQDEPAAAAAASIVGRPWPGARLRPVGAAARAQRPGRWGKNRTPNLGDGWLPGGRRPGWKPGGKRASKPWMDKW